jgi:hypothetical protein
MHFFSFSTLAASALFLLACSSGSGSGGGAAGMGAATGQGGSGGVASDGGVGNGTGSGGISTGGNAGQPTGGSGGGAGTGSTGAGGSGGQTGGAGGTPSTPGCSAWQGDCNGETGCKTDLSTEDDCGACGVSCPASQACAGTVCAEAINPSSFASTESYLGQDGVILIFKESTSVRAVVKVHADSGVATKFGTLEGDANVYCSSPRVAEGPDGAVYFACLQNRIFKLGATGGTATDLVQGSVPTSNNIENIAVFGTKVFYVGADGIYRVNDDGTGNELWTKNYCVSGLGVDASLAEIVFFCRYDHTIRVRGANKAPELTYVYDRELAAQAESSFAIDSTHYWYQRLDSLVGSFYQGEILRVPKQGGTEEAMLDIFSPPVTRFHVGKGGPYVLQLIDEADHHFRVLKLGSNGAHQVAHDWIHGYGKSGSSFFFVGQSHLIFDPYGSMVRLPL